MSAFIVSENHINVIVSYFVDSRPMYRLYAKINGAYQYLTHENAAKVAQTLYAENVRSVDVRYSEENDSRYTFKYLPMARLHYSIADIAGALDCLEYQSCETDDYYRTEAYALITAMRKRLLKRLQDHEGCDTWEIVEVQPVRRAA